MTALVFILSLFFTPLARAGGFKEVKSCWCKDYPGEFIFLVRNRRVSLLCDDSPAIPTTSIATYELVSSPDGDVLVLDDRKAQPSPTALLGGDGVSRLECKSLCAQPDRVERENYRGDPGPAKSVVPGAAFAPLLPENEVPAGSYLSPIYRSCSCPGTLGSYDFTIRGHKMSVEQDRVREGSRKIADYESTTSGEGVLWKRTALHHGQAPERINGGVVGNDIPCESFCRNENTEPPKRREGPRLSKD